MRTEDLQLVSSLGQSLWNQPEQSRAITRETVAAATVLDANPDRALEKALQALLDRANQKGMYARVPSGFNALFPEERFILLALHRGRWSYARIARVVRDSAEMVQQLAWNARAYLALSHYPAAPATASPSCPEYDPQRPWTQRFLDEELGGQERMFLQAHLAGCAACRTALMRAKDLFYRVQTRIDELDAQLSKAGLTAQLHTLVEQGRRFRYPSTATPAQALQRFFQRTDIRILVVGWIVFLIWLSHRH